MNEFNRLGQRLDTSHLTLKIQVILSDRQVSLQVVARRNQPIRALTDELARLVLKGRGEKAEHYALYAEQKRISEHGKIADLAATPVLDYSRYSIEHLSLVFEQGGRVVPIRFLPCVLGRPSAKQEAEEYKVTLDKSMLADDLSPDLITEISRRHIRLSMESEVVMMEDLAKGPKTLINNSQIAPDTLHPLKNGDVIQLAGLRLRFEDSRATASAEQPST